MMMDNSLSSVLLVFLFGSVASANDHHIIDLLPTAAISVENDDGWTALQFAPPRNVRRGKRNPDENSMSTIVQRP